MNTVTDTKANRNYFLVLRNKKINNYDYETSVLNTFAADGVYFDNASYISYDSSQEIVGSLKYGIDNYENVVIACPKVMEKTLKKYISWLYGSEFNEIGILKNGRDRVFLFFWDSENRLLLSDISSAINTKRGKSFGKVYLRTVGASQEKINSALEKAKRICGELEFNVNNKFGDCKIEIIYDNELKKSIFDNAYRTVLSSLNDYVYAIEDIPLAERLVQLLKLRRMKICVAESFTGGGVGKRIVQVSGASEVYFEGVNTYSNASKIARLGVDEETLLLKGAVSDETAAQMAEGLIADGNCDVAISTTGIAGPKSDNTKKPVGLLYIGIATKNGVSVYKYNLSGSREEITETAINTALFLALKTVK